MRRAQQTTSTAQNGFLYHRLKSYTPEAPEHLRRSIAQTYQSHGDPNTASMREWLFSCFEYPEQIGDFLSKSGPVPRLKGVFTRSVDIDLLAHLARELRETAQVCLPTIPGTPGLTDPLDGVARLWQEGTYMEPISTIEGGDEANPHFIVLSQLSVLEVTPRFKGDCNYMIFSRPPLSGPWDTETSETLSDWVATHLSPTEGTEFRVFMHTPSEYGERIEYVGAINHRNDTVINPTQPLDTFACYRPSFVDHGLVEHVNTVPNDQIKGAEDYPGDRFSRYLQLEFARARDAIDVEKMNELSQAHLHHTLRRMRNAVHSYRPPHYDDYWSLTPTQ